MSVSLGRVNQIFQSFDFDRNGKLDRPETAHAAINLLSGGADNADALINNTLPADILQQSQTEGTLFATFVQGGVDQQGLFPDENGDGAITMQEIAGLAGASGDSNALEGSDFQAGFGARFQAGGQAGDIEGLKQIASQSSTLGNLNNTVGQFTQAPTDNALLSQVMNIMMSVMQMLTTLFGAGSIGGNPGQGQPSPGPVYNPPPPPAYSPY